MEKEKKLSKIKIAVIISVAVVFLCVAVFVLVLVLKPGFRYKVKSFFNSGKNEVALTAMSAKELDTEKVEVSEFIKWENVSFNQSMMLVNNEHTLADDYEADISEYKTTGVMMNSCMRDDYSDMSLDIIDKFDNTLYIMSSYRTAEEQEEISKEQDEESAMKAGASEHQTGLALDVYITEFAGAGFINCDVGQWVNQNSWKYGFIIRYPQFKEDITGIKFEPWHIRYVGFPHSEIIYNNSLTLEEHIAGMEIGKFYKFGKYIYTRQKGDEITVPADCKSYVVSEDNTGCFIITGKR
ncbi:MAG: D-alanyl-D-alanine carboxypeptidase family protein [Ruminococcus sp.]|nr:D-alanyl-D-alanine carboxypeptidase family protein [Ruminococcus sp.]